MLFQTALSEDAVGAFRRAAPKAPILHVSEQQNHPGVFWISNADPCALIERAKGLLSSEFAAKSPPSIGALVVDAERGSVSIAGQRVNLSRAQFRLLLLLLRGRGRVFEREVLCSHVLGTHGSPRRIDWHVARLRASLGPMAWCIETWPTGYSMARLSDELGGPRVSPATTSALSTPRSTRA